MASSSAPSIESFASRIRTPGYLILIVTACLPMLDFVAGSWPLQLANPTWRFGVLGLLANYSLGFVGELFLIFVLAVAASDRKVLIALGIVTTAMAVLLFIGCGGFALDAVQTRVRVTPQTVHRFDFAALEGLLKLILVVVSNIVLSRSAFRAARTGKARSDRSRVAETPAVITTTRRPSPIPAAQQEL